MTQYFEKNEVFDRIRQDIGENDIVLYMKGTAVFPQCGFSAAVVQILQNIGVPFKDIDVLSEPGLGQGIKDFTNWPTTPQLYVKGEFIGGCDIVRELYASGDLEGLLYQKGLLKD
ncbi:MAG: Grx4 family monothiol glutaredoxin [Alphaproteobacteria bacterium]|nr:Grx4 family monothiol glutaredoxin [Alphaproteobacteria bacterium]